MYKCVRLELLIRPLIEARSLFLALDKAFDRVDGEGLGPLDGETESTSPDELS